MRSDQPDESLVRPSADLLGAAVSIVSAYVAHVQVKSEEVPALIQSVFGVLVELRSDRATPKELKPAVQPNKSVHEDYIVCLEDGRRLKMLKRCLKATYDLSPDEYRRKWGLSHDYPMVAPAYAKRRSEFAKRIGLGKSVRKSDAS